MMLNAEVVNLPEGDIVIENDDGSRWTIERKLGRCLLIMEQ